MPYIGKELIKSTEQLKQESEDAFQRLEEKYNEVMGALARSKYDEVSNPKFFQSLFERYKIDPRSVDIEHDINIAHNPDFTNTDDPVAEKRDKGMRRLTYREALLLWCLVVSLFILALTVSWKATFICTIVIRINDYIDRHI